MDGLLVDGAIAAFHEAAVERLSESTPAATVAVEALRSSSAELGVSHNPWRLVVHSNMGAVKHNLNTAKDFKAPC